MIFARLVLFATALFAAAIQSPRPKARETDGNKLVKVALRADHDVVRAGDAFQLCIVLDVKPGWHVYWENPGDAGNPTRIELAGPDGFELGAPRFPCPVRHEEEGDIVSYVHEGEVLVLFDIEARARDDGVLAAPVLNRG